MKRSDLVKRWGMLETERTSMMPMWRELSTYILPYNGRYFLEDRDKSKKRFNQIYDNTGTRALRILGAGLLAGATSPARPWFRLQTHDDELNAYQPVKIWLDQVSTLMLKVFSKSNTYRSLHSMYEELGCFGTAAAVIVPNYRDVVHHDTLTCGEYSIATDALGDVCTLYRRFQMQVSSLVKEFGRDNCSESVKGMYDSGNLDQWVSVTHAIEPRADRNPSKRDNKNMAWGSYYFEDGNEDKYLREGGFKRFPAVVPRWAVAGGDIYGNSPGMEAVGDIKQLQHEQKRKAMAIDYQTNPPMLVPASMKSMDVDILPGGLSYYSEGSNPQAIRPLREVNLDLSHLLPDIQDARGRIQSSMYTDLFMMISQASDAQDPRMTATEIAARQEEKMLMLGPVLERLSNELLYPMVNITFDHMIESGALPPPPQELQGMELGVELQSVLAQAQQAIGTNGIDRFVGSLGQIAAFKPDILDKFDSDSWADIYSDKLGVDPSMVVASDKVAMVRDARAKAQAAAQQAATMEQQSKTAKNLATAPTQGGGSVYDELNSVSGYTNQPIQ